MDWLNNTPELPKLAHGSHREGSGKLCAMELVAFMERLPHSDAPECTCPVLAQYTRTLNDRIPDARRGELLPVLPRLVGTVNPELEQKRGEYFAMQVATKLVPITLDGIIDKALVAAMREAKDLDAARAAARAAYAAARAADAAAYAADAAYAAARAAARTNHDFWAHAIEILIGAIELDPHLTPAQWERGRIVEAVSLTNDRMWCVETETFDTTDSPLAKHCP